MAGKKGRSGRPTKLFNPRVRQTIIDAIRNGCYIHVAARAAGIDRATFFRWMADGEQQKSGVYRDFYDEVKTVEAACEAESIRVIQTAGLTTWTARAWFLERKYPERWARRERIETTVEPEPNVTTLSDSELETLTAIESES